jgi:hypothetical protein
MTLGDSGFLIEPVPVAGAFIAHKNFSAVFSPN